MVDFMEHSMRQIAQQNVIRCAKKLNYFSHLEEFSNKNRLKELPEDARNAMLELAEVDIDSQMDNCLGKFSDSYESALDVFSTHLRNMRLSKITTHTQELDPTAARSGYVMGGDREEPIYAQPKI